MEIRYPNFSEGNPKVIPSYFWLSATATATATVAPTMGLLPIERRPFLPFYYSIIMFFREISF